MEGGEIHRASIVKEVVGTQPPVFDGSNYMYTSTWNPLPIRRGWDRLVLEPRRGILRLQNLIQAPKLPQATLMAIADQTGVSNRAGRSLFYLAVRIVSTSFIMELDYVHDQNSGVELSSDYGMGILHPRRLCRGQGGLSLLG
jgi:hypothetical protein